MKRFLSILTFFFTAKEYSTKINKNIKISVSYQDNQIEKLDSLTRYYEANYEKLLDRGVWLLTVMRDAEVNEKYMAIVNEDEKSGKIKSINKVILH